MVMEFIEMAAFQKAWNDMDLTDDDLLELEVRLLINPNLGKVIKGSGGARKVRCEAYGKGKSGGVRVIYVNIVVDKAIYFIFAYPKSIKDTLTDQEIKSIKKMVELLKS